MSREGVIWYRANNVVAVSPCKGENFIFFCLSLFMANMTQ